MSEVPVLELCQRPELLQSPEPFSSEPQPEKKTR